MKASNGIRKDREDQSWAILHCSNVFVCDIRAGPGFCIPAKTSPATGILIDSRRERKARQDAEDAFESGGGT
jgi:hypothetical protein